MQNYTQNPLDCWKGNAIPARSSSYYTYRILAPFLILLCSDFFDFKSFDWAKFTFADWFFQPSYSQFMRIVEYNVSVDNQGLEEIDFTLNTERDETYDDETEDNG